MPVQHVKGQPAASTYVQEKGGVKIGVDLRTPCSWLGAKSTGPWVSMSVTLSVAH